jgi:glycosyltransferase involved in cell wall biosynthesis
MKVTFLTGEYPPMQGGIADYTAILAQHLQKLDVRPSVLISRAYRRPPATAPVTVYPDVRSWGLRCWQDIGKFLERHPTDILHIQYQAAAFDLGGWVNWLPWFLRRRRNHPKFVTTFHDLRIPYLFPKAGFLRWQSILALARYSDAVICTNPEDEATLHHYPWATHLTQIPLGTNIPLNPPPDYDRQVWRNELGFAEQSIVLAYFGFLNESKGGEDLIAALAALVERGQDARLLIIGGELGDSDPANRAYAQRIRQLIAERDLASRIVFTGYVDLPQVSAHLLAADLAVMPYRDGVSFRRTTLIAILQHGLPVISTTPAICLPQIVDGENMLLVPPADAPALSEAVIRVASDPDLAKHLGQGASMLGASFDWAQIVARTAQLYASLLQGA